MERLLAGRYELHERLGSSTWRATDTELEREVAVRFGEIGGATLSHQNVVRVFDQGEEDGERFAVLEYLPGGTLAERGALSDAAAGDVAAALAYAHAAGVPHGALDADAILFDAQGRAKVTGFTGAGDPEADVAALDALRRAYPPGAGEAATAVIAPAPAPPAPPPSAGRSRRAAALGVAAVLLALGGLTAALVVTSGGGTEPSRTTDPIASAPIGTMEEEPEPPLSAPPTSEETDTATQPTTQATTTEPEPEPTLPTAPVPTVPPLPTEPLPTLPTLPPTTEELPVPTVTPG